MKTIILLAALALQGCVLPMGAALNAMGARHDVRVMEDGSIVSTVPDAR